MARYDKERLLCSVLGEYGVDADEFRSMRRTRVLCFARMTYVRLRRDMGARVEDIGEEINRDHSTVSHMASVHMADYQYCAEYRRKFDKIKNEVTL